jgi:hypothetical protein
MPRYSDTPYGLKANSGRKFPTNAQPISTAPQATARPIFVYEQDGKRHAALFHKGQWMRVVSQPRDPYSGTTRVAMDGSIVHNPIAWTTSS